MSGRLILRGSDYLGEPLLPKVRKIVDIDSVAANEVASVSLHDGNNPGVNAGVLVL